MRALFTALMAGLACALATCAPAPRSEGPALWRLSDADSEIWLFGTVHVLAPGLRWRTPAIDAAFAGAEELITETDIGPAVEQELAGLTARYGALPEGQSLSALLARENRARLARVARGLGLGAAELERRRPWLAALQISYAHAVRSGRSVEAGVESVLIAEARASGTRQSFLETPEDQIRMLAALPEAAQLRLLSAGLTQIENDDRILDAMDEAWAAGDVEGLGVLLDAQWRGAGPEVHEALILARNRAWADAIAAELDGAGRVFIAVGAAHLAGEGNVIALLRARGYAVEGP